MKSPPISVVVPSFRHGPYVTDALQSVVDQTYPEVELVVIDDASPDDSADRIRSFLERPEVIDRFAGRIVCQTHTTNRGADATINEGVRRAGGEVIAILNSDDRYHPSRLAEMIDALPDGPGGLGLAFSRVEVTEDTQEGQQSGEFSRYIGTVQSSIATFPSVGFSAVRQNVAISTGNFVFTRALWERVGPFSALKYCHDWDFLLRCVAIVEPVYVDRPLYVYRHHPSNSFHELADVAEAESRAVLTDFFSRVDGGRAANPLVPGPYTWPGVFEFQLTSWAFWDHWECATGERNRRRGTSGPAAYTATRPTVPAT